MSRVGVSMLYGNVAQRCHTCIMRGCNAVLKRPLQLKTWLWGLCGLLFVLLLTFPFPSFSAGNTIRVARPTWDTGWFQAEIYRQLLQELGYRVEAPRTLDNEAFYSQVAAGGVDFWASGWFPMHNAYLIGKDIQNKVELVGFEVAGGALQGYLVDRITADRLDIRSLEAFAQPHIAAQFDQDKDGKADLIGCNVGWTCGEVIDYHLKTYNLDRTVEQIQGDYAPLLESAIQRYRNGEPLFVYTWTPNWTLSQLIPGRDVVWLEVPFSSLPPEQQSLESETIIPGIEGCGADLCNLGFPRNDIRVVANHEFLVANPAARSLLEQVKIPLEEITAQNAKMLAGEGSEADIRRHAQEWIQAHREQVDVWMKAARQVADVPPLSDEPPEPDRLETTLSGETLRVVTKRFEPFVT